MKNPSAIKTVPLLDLKGQYASIKEEVTVAMERVLASQYFILGPEVEALEKEIAEYCGCQYAVGVSSGTDALLACLMALGVSAGDEVITTPFSFFATAGSILRVGATPVFVDIEPDTFNIDPARVAQAVTPRTKAMIPVHLYGQSSDMGPLMSIARSHSIAVIEDAAQAIGAEYGGQRVGSIGTAGCFSFFPSKNLGCFGDGGMVTTNDKALAERIKILRNQGSDPKYYHKVLGGNFRLDALQAAVLRIKLKHLDSWTEQRRANAHFYTRRLKELGLSGGPVVPPPIIHERHVHNQYVIRAKERDRLREFLATNGVTTEIYYPMSLHLQECVTDGRYKQGDFPVSEEASKCVLALPVFPELTLEQKEQVVSTIAKFYGA